MLPFLFGLFLFHYFKLLSPPLTCSGSTPHPLYLHLLCFCNIQLPFNGSPNCFFSLIFVSFFSNAQFPCLGQDHIPSSESNALGRCSKGSVNGWRNIFSFLALSPKQVRSFLECMAPPSSHRKDEVLGNEKGIWTQML